MSVAMRWILVLLWMSVIYYFSDQPNSNQVTEQIFGPLNYWVRKGAHMTEYAILFFLIRFSLIPKRNHKESSLIALILSLIYAASDEWHQSFVKGRSAQASDVAIDLVGALLCWLGIQLSIKLSSRSRV